MNRRIHQLAFILVVLVISTFDRAVYSATWLEELPAIPAITLQNQDGRNISFDELLAGRTVLVNFMFTTCAGVCPTQTAVLRAARGSLAAQGKNVLVISVTVDPATDSPEQLRNYARRFEIKTGVENGWVFLTGSSQQIRRVMAAFGELGNLPDVHAGLVWIGNQQQKHWTRLTASNGADAIAKLARDAGQK